MRVFNVNRRYVNGTEVFDNLNCNLSISDVRTIIQSLEKFKFDDVVLASCKTELLSNLKNLCHE